MIAARKAWSVLLAEVVDGQFREPDAEREGESDQEDRIPGEASGIVDPVVALQRAKTARRRRGGGRGDRYAKETAVPGRGGEEEKGDRYAAG